MAFNIGTAVVRVVADAAPFSKSLRRQMVSAQKSATSQAQSMGKKIGESLAKAAEKPVSRLRKTLGAAVLVIPLLTSALGALGGVVTALSGSLIRAASSSASLVGVIGALTQAAIVGKLAFSGFGEAVGGNAEALAKLSPNARAAAEAVRGLGGQWRELKKSLQEKVFAGLADDISRVGNTLLPILQRNFQGTATQLNLLLTDLAKFAQSESFVQRFGKALRGNNVIFQTLRQAAVPLLDGLLSLFIALQPAALRLAGVIKNAAISFQGWATSAEGMESIRNFMVKAGDSAGLLWRLVKNLAVALFNVTQVGASAGDGLIKTFGDLAIKFRNFTESASGKNQIASFINTSVEAFRTFGRVIASTAGVFKALFNPAIFGGFMSIIETLTPTIKEVAGVIQGALAPILDNIGAALAKNGPKIAALFVALGPLLKGVGAVIGEIISQALDLVGTVAAVITPVVGAISKFLGPVLVKLAPVIAAIILAFGGFGATLVRLVPIVGRFLAPVVKLASWLLGKLGPAVKFIGKVIGVVFKGIAAVIGGSLRVAGKVVQTQFTIIRTIISTAMNIIKGIISVVWIVIGRTVTTVVSGIASAVRLYFGIVRTVVTTVFNAVRSVITAIWSGISAYFSAVLGTIRTVFVNTLGGLRTIVSSVFRVIRTVITTAMGAIRTVISTAWNAVKTATSAVWNGIKTVVTSVLNGLKNLIKTGFNAIVNTVKSVPGKILALGASFLNAGRSLGEKVIDGIGKGLSAAGGFISDIASSVKNAINSALNLPVTIKGPGPLPDFTIPAFARGVKNFSGGMALVGERGPELVNLPRGSDVVPNRQTRSMVSTPAPAAANRTEVKVDQHYYGPTTNAGRLRELDWTLRYATGTRSGTVGAG